MTNHPPTRDELRRAIATFYALDWTPHGDPDMCEAAYEKADDILALIPVLGSMSDRLGMVDAVLHTWREAGPLHPQTGELWRMIRAAVDGTMLADGQPTWLGAR